MHARLITLVLLLAAIFQGSAPTFAAGFTGDGASAGCSDSSVVAGKDCDPCCSHALMTSCAALCAVPAVFALAAAVLNITRLAPHAMLVPDAGVAPFANHSPPHPLRPPIV